MATSGDLQLALLIKANAQQARAELAATQAQLKGVEDSAKQAGSGFGAYNASLNDITAAQRTAAAAAGETTDALAATSQAFTTTATATAATGETTEQAAARIHAMVQASLAAQDAALGRSAAEVAAAKTARGTVDAAAAQSTAWRDLAAAQTASMQAYTTARAPVLQLQALLEKSTLTTAEVAQAEALLDRAQAAGVISAGELAEAFDLLDKAKIKDVAVTKAQTKANEEGFAASLNYRSRREVGTIGAEALSGNFGRVRTSGLALANDMGLFTKLLSPVGLAVTGVVAALGTLAIAFAKGQAESDKFNRALVSTGAAGNTTAGQLVDMANQVGASTGRYGDAVTALTDLANTGKYTASQLQGLTQTAVDFATMTGGKVADGVKFVDAVMSGNIGTIQKLDEQYHFLTASQFEEIQRLIDQGQQEQATAIAQQAASKAVHDRAQEVQDNAGIMIRAWDGVKSAAAAAWNAMKDVGATHSIGQQLKDAMADLQQAKGTHLDRAGNMVQNASPEAIAALNSKINDLRAQLVAQGFAQTQKAVQENADTKAKQGLADLAKFKTPLEAFQDATAKAKKDLDNVMLGNLTADEIARAKMHYQQALDQAQKAYDSATKKHGPKGPNIDHAQLNADVAAVQNQLRTLSNAWQNTQRVLDAQHRAGQLSDQQYFDALRKDLDQYTQQRIAALEQEKQAATAHVKTAADRIRADQKVQQIDAEITQTRQDASAKHIEIDAKEQQSIEKSRQEWEQLRRSFETPAEVRAEDAIAQIQKLNKALANGVITARQYHDALQQIGQKAVANALPTYRGVSGAVGGPYGELQKNFQAEHALIAAYEAQKLALKKKFNDQDSAQEQAHQAALAALDAQYAEKRNIIEQSRQQLYLTGAETFFNQLAQLSSSKNKTLATIGKAASIASTLVKAYQSGTEARAALSGIPYIGPALGIAAEAAAIAAGLANVAQMRAQNVTSGYLAGGYTGNAPITQAVGVVHGREGVLSAPEIDAIGGEAGFNALRGMIRRGYATGGYVSPFANAPSPSDLGFSAPVSPRMDFRRIAAANDSATAARAPNVKVVAVWDRDQAAHEVLNTPTGHKVIVQTVGDNPRTIQGKWQAG